MDANENALINIDFFRQTSDDSFKGFRDKSRSGNSSPSKPPLTLTDRKNLPDALFSYGEFQEVNRRGSQIGTRRSSRVTAAKAELVSQSKLFEQMISRKQS